TSRPCSRSTLAINRNCVDFPLPSMPSKVINAPATCPLVQAGRSRSESSGTLGVAGGCGSLARAFIFALRPQLSAGAPPVRARRDGVFENQLLLRCGFKH